MVRASEHELQLLDRYVDGLKKGGDDIFVVLGAEVDQLNGCFEVVEEAMNIREEDLDRTTGAEEVCEFQYGDKVAAVGSTCCRCACTWGESGFSNDAVEQVPQ